MGEHFDSLVECVNNPGHEIDRDHLKNLRRIVRNAALFEFEKDFPTLFPNHSATDVNARIEDYAKSCESIGDSLLTPFKVTAIEEPNFVSILEKKLNGNYGFFNTIKAQNSAVIFVSDLEFDLKTPSLLIDFQTKYTFDYSNNRLIHSEFNSNEDKLKEGQESFFEIYLNQLAYIMDPSNFIIEKEQTQSMQRTRSLANHKRKGRKIKERKTILRPHYLCLNEADTKAFLQGESKNPRSSHPVRGHWREYKADRYVNMKGQRKFIKQYFTGQGILQGAGGWTYRVMVKESPTEIKYYSENTT